MRVLLPHSTVCSCYVQCEFMKILADLHGLCWKDLVAVKIIGIMFFGSTWYVNLTKCICQAVLYSADSLRGYTRQLFWS
jgi:hypothetical protein